MRRPKTIHVISLGCSKNFVDTEVMCGHLAVHGFALTGSLDDADIVLINTCGFLESARDEAGGENEAEFFAVATEEFFDRPLALQKHAPDLYHVLSAYYHQDPAARVKRTCPAQE